MAKMTKEERMEARAFANEMQKLFVPQRKISLGMVVQKFCELSNSVELRNEFEKKSYQRDEFCSKFQCPKWVYDFLSDMVKLGCAKRRLEKNLAEVSKKKSLAVDVKKIFSRKVKGLCVAARPLRREDFSEPTMIVVINNWNPCNNDAQSLYDATRGYWSVGKSGKAYKCKWVVASYRGRVMEVYEIDRSKLWMTWQESPKKSMPNDQPANPKRRAFEGRIAPDEIRAKFIGRSTSGLILPRTEKVYVGV